MTGDRDGTLEMHGEPEMLTLYTDGGEGIALVHYCVGGDLRRMLDIAFLYATIELESKVMSDLRSQLSSLSAAEKVELLDAVWESLEADAQSLTDAQRAELDFRLARSEKNPSDVVS